jgi:hypothetical protein
MILIFHVLPVRLAGESAFASLICVMDIKVSVRQDQSYQ